MSSSMAWRSMLDERDRVWRGDGDETRRCMASWNGESMSSLASRKSRSRWRSVEVKSPWWRLGIGDPRRRRRWWWRLGNYVSTWWEQAKKWVCCSMAKEMRGRFGSRKPMVTMVWLGEAKCESSYMLILEWLYQTGQRGARDLPKYKQERYC